MSNEMRSCAQGAFDESILTLILLGKNKTYTPTRSVTLLFTL